MSVTTHTLSCGPLVEVAGDLDHHNAPQVHEALTPLALRAGQQLLIDLGGLTFCDSTGITVLIAARNQALAARADIALVAVPDRVRRIFRIVGLDQVFPTYPTVPEAEAAWTPPPAAH
ncbi:MULTISPECIES: STAS domain-containing protein [unclassified Streptomyces]|uniref:STAS domain-containing protein n=1 Tax=unclassified Streptomyces TaxID=2593676 RepID=UPI001F4260EA|nr:MULTISPECIES: STAS domain-containing protein [unclassified Streptomyces]